MTLAATSAFAPTFTHTSAAPDVTLTFAAGVSPVTASLATGSYRMWLAPSASCYLRALATAIKVAVAAARTSSAILVVASLAADGTVTFTFTGDIPATITFAAPMWRALGFASASPSLSGGAITGVRPVWYLALMSATKHGPWLPLQAGGTEQTTGGVVYAIAASATSWQRKHAVTLQPTNPAQRSAQGAEATALLPAPASMGALGATDTAREWSILDVLQVSRSALCGMAIDNWPTARTSTSEVYYAGYVGGPSLLSPELTSPDESYEAWSEWTLLAVLPTTGQTETRA